MSRDGFTDAREKVCPWSGGWSTECPVDRVAELEGRERGLRFRAAELEAELAAALQHVHTFADDDPTCRGCLRQVR